MHTNFSTKYLREVGGKEYLEALMKAFENNIAAHIEVYGPDNHLRLTGLHETQAIDKFSYGLSDRGASVRLPVNFIKNGYKGYLEDRRPNSEGDPYQIISRILKTINTVPPSRTFSRSCVTKIPAAQRGSRDFLFSLMSGLTDVRLSIQAAPFAA